MAWWKFWSWFTPDTSDDIDTAQEILDADPDYLLPSLSLIVGSAPTPTLTSLGGGVYQLKFLKTKIQPAVWMFLKVNEHFVVNLTRCTAGIITAKSSDAINYIVTVQVSNGNVWTNGDPLVPQTQKFVLHFSHKKIADFLARDRDYILGWRDDGTWGLLRQAVEYDPNDARELKIASEAETNLDASMDFDLQVLMATGKVLSTCRSDAIEKPMSGLSDGEPPFEIRRNVSMTLREALELREVMRAGR